MTTTTPLVLGADAGDRSWLLTGERLVKATAEQTGGASIGEERMPAGTATPLHVHDQESEAYYVLDGEVDLHVGEAPPARLGPGSFALVPAGVPHAHVVVRDARWLGISGPRFGRFLDEAGVPVADGEPRPAPDLARVLAAAERNATRIVGAPPA